jgi:site-specific DNA-methyltransferase (adenine-specific)
MRQMPSESIDLVVTSPPYDDLRTYGGHSWDFDAVADQLCRILRPGAGLVWVVSDATKNGSETGASMRQAIGFMDRGLKLHDTMIWEKTGSGCMGSPYCYAQNFEFMFVLSNGKMRTTNMICDRENVVKSGSVKVNGVNGGIRKDGTFDTKVIERKPFGKRTNVWRINPAQKQGHPAPFPEQLARDHVLSWSNQGDVVLDPFNGSGTTTKVAQELGRRFIGIEVNSEYVAISRGRMGGQRFLLDGVA